jgi:hypothetical protein
MNYKLSPSDLTFLFDGCKHCFVLKVKYGIQQPSIPIPGVFSIIASLQKNHYSGKRLENLSRELPPGVIKYGEKYVKSKTLELPDCNSTCYISGRFDIVAELDDGSYAILDFKTGSPNDEKSQMYARQLQCYALALENPAPNSFHLSPISKLGLLYFSPDKCEQLDMTRQILEGQIQWVEIERNDQNFLNFLKDVVSLLDGPLPEIQPDSCEWCKYHSKKSVFKQENVGFEQIGDNTLPKCPICGSDMRRKSGIYGDFWSCIKFPDCRGTRKI